jgi:hypothetical protein
MRLFTAISAALLLPTCVALANVQQVPALDAPPPTAEERSSLLGRVIANQKKNDEAQNIYERLERVESRKNGPSAPPEIKISRAIPAGTGIDRIVVGPDGKPLDPVAYRSEMEKLERSLLWASGDGRSQREAYDKIAKKMKDRNDLIDTTRTAFLYTFLSREMRANRVLAKYRLEPNPAFKPTNRTTAAFAHVNGFLWIDEAAAQLARAEIEVTDDISIGGFLAKIYKGSHLMQERYEMVPGLWFPSYAQYDFDGRKLFVSFAIHERTFYTQYRRIGPPKEALADVRAELSKLKAAAGDP